MRMSHHGEGFNIEVVGFEEVGRNIISFLNALNIYIYIYFFFPGKVFGIQSSKHCWNV
jgi:hypothetical protein